MKTIGVICDDGGESLKSLGSSCGVSDDDCSDGMVGNSERMGGAPPQGPAMLTIAVGVGNDEGVVIIVEDGE